MIKHAGFVTWSCELPGRVHEIYICCFTPCQKIDLKHHFKSRPFEEEMWSKIFVAGHGFSTVAGNCS